MRVNDHSVALSDESGRLGPLGASLPLALPVALAGSLALEV